MLSHTFSLPDTLGHRYHYRSRKRSSSPGLAQGHVVRTVCVAELGFEPRMSLLEMPLGLPQLRVGSPTQQEAASVIPEAGGDPYLCKQPWGGRASRYCLDLCWLPGDKLGTFPLPGLVFWETSEDGFWGYLEGKEKGDPEVLLKLASDYVTWLCLKPFHGWLPRTMSKMSHLPLWSS